MSIIKQSDLGYLFRLRPYSEIAEDYWNREYLDYADNDWYQEQHVVRILTPLLERIFS